MRYEAYTDGSYKEFKESHIALYSSAVIIAAEGSSNWTQLVSCGRDPDYLAMHNAAGEIIAAVQLFEHCLNVLKLQPDDLLLINFDHVGIHNWLKQPGEKDYWKCKRKVTKAYRDYYYAYVKPRFKVIFNHVESHTGITGNEIVDKLAKQAIEQHYLELCRK